jgi:hypothetical protein
VARRETRGRLVEEHQVGGDDDAAGDVELAPHAARVGLDLAGGRLRQVEGVEQLVGPGFGLGARVPEQPAEEHEVLPAGELLVHGGVLPRQADAAAYRVGLADDIVAEHPCGALVGLEQRREHPDRGRLTGAVRPEEPVDGPGAHGEVDAVDGSRRAERLHQAGRFDGEGGTRVQCRPVECRSGAVARTTVHPRQSHRHRAIFPV